MHWSRYIYFCLLVFGILLKSCTTEDRDPIQERQMFLTPYELDSLNNTTATYPQIIDFYYRLSLRYRSMRLFEIGETDSGEPLHAVIISKDGIFEPDTAHNRGYRVIMVNNGIHPGEPCGIDASMMFSREILIEQENQSLLNNTILVIIPVYNVGGALNRSATSRVNQIGPSEYGFRGNARNLDLNRDFLKSDSKNAQSFNRFFSKWRPHIFIDTHTSNGADYQHVMTLLSTQSDKLAPSLQNILKKNLEPFLYKSMHDAGFPMCPYVNTRGIPDDGIDGFNDLPRYSTGYAALFNSIGFMTEAHMLKPYYQRVQATEAFLWAIMKYNRDNGAAISAARAQAENYWQKVDTMALHWQIDRTVFDSIEFRGYEADYKPSDITGELRLFYDINRPYIKPIAFYNSYKPIHFVQLPEAYIVPRAWTSIVARLQQNHVKMVQLDSSVTKLLNYYRIESFETVKQPYEGKYLHYNTKVSSHEGSIELQAGDWLVPVRQPAIQFIVNALEPQAPDSWFNWGYFDAVLQRKEYFSAYLFEDIALDVLEDDPELKENFKEMKSSDPGFALDAMTQLRFIYENSEFSEPEFNRYPVFRVLPAEKNAINEEEENAF
jgi:hypothetical protein